jgi:hypothetical protein
VHRKAWAGCLHAAHLALREADAVSKSDAYGLVTGVSLQTAMKYVNKAIADGYLEESDKPADGRSRLIRLSPLLRDRRLDREGPRLQQRQAHEIPWRRSNSRSRWVTADAVR